MYPTYTKGLNENKSSIFHVNLEGLIERVELVINRHLRLFLFFISILHFGFSYGVGVFHIFGFYDSIANTIFKFSVLLSPPSWTFIIAWPIIIVTQAVFVIVHLNPKQQQQQQQQHEQKHGSSLDRDMNEHHQRQEQDYDDDDDDDNNPTKDGNRENILKIYIISCVFQIFWTYTTLCHQVMLWSVLLIFCQIITIIHLSRIQQHPIQTENLYFLIHQFPHLFNLSWLYFLLIIMLQILNQQSAMYFKSQITWSFICIALILFLGVYHGELSENQYKHPTVTFTLASLLLVTTVQKKDEAVVAQFGQDIIFTLNMSCCAISGVLFFLSIKAFRNNNQRNDDYPVEDRATNTIHYYS